MIDVFLFNETVHLKSFLNFDPFIYFKQNTFHFSYFTSFNYLTEKQNKNFICRIGYFLIENNDVILGFQLI